MSRSDPLTGVPVTGEAVTLDLRVARLPSRTVALALDLCVQIPVLVAALMLAGLATTGLDAAATAAILLAVFAVVIVGYPLLIESLTRGRSVGKLALGLRVVRDDGGPVRVRHSLVRALFLVFELWITSGVVGLISCLASAQGKRLGDVFAGTIVVNQRVARAAAYAAAAPVPPTLAPWAATLDLSRLPESPALAAASLLTRWSALEPGVRDRLAARLADEISALVAPPPPPGVPPPAYLAAVVGERARRTQPTWGTPAPNQPPPAARGTSATASPPPAAWGTPAPPPTAWGTPVPDLPPPASFQPAPTQPTPPGPPAPADPGTPAADLSPAEPVQPSPGTPGPFRPPT